MKTHALEFDFDEVIGFAQQHIPGLAVSADMRVIGLKAHGQMVAAAVYEGFNGSNMWVHLAAVSGARWMVREFLRAGFDYPFAVCGVQRLSGYVNADNAAARRFNEHIGFKPEAVLRGAGPDGGDVIVYVMWKKDCRYVSMARQ